MHSHSDLSPSALGSSFDSRASSRASSMSDHNLKSTSRWDTDMLDKLGIIYQKDFVESPIDILDMVHSQTGMFCPLTVHQKNYVKALQEQINYSFSITDLVGLEVPHNLVAIVEDVLIPAIKKDMTQMKTVITDPEFSSGEFIFSMIEDFIRSTKLMIQHQLAIKTRNCDIQVPDNVFVDIFKVFVKMCGLLPYPGQFSRTTMNIMHQNVTSETDVVIMTDDQSFSVRPDIVSIVKVKNLTSGIKAEKKEEEAKIKHELKTDSSKDQHEPAIYNTVKNEVLAQHGGELLMHNRFYKRQLKLDRQLLQYNPGIIVIGTQVYFTLLELKILLEEEIETNEVVKQHKSYIFYSEPKDLLKKEDRDVLIEALVRMKN